MNLHERATSFAVIVLFAMGSGIGADESDGKKEPPGPHAEIDGCRVFVEPRTTGPTELVVRAANPEAEARTLRFTLAVSATEMFSMSRVGPVPREVARLDLELEVPAGQTVEKTLTLKDLEPKDGTSYSVSAIHGDLTTPYLASFGGLKKLHELMKIEEIR